MQYRAALFSLVYFSAVHNFYVQYILVQYSILQFMTVDFNADQYIAVQCSVYQCSTFYCSTLQLSAVQLSAVQLSAVQAYCSAVQCWAGECLCPVAVQTQFTDRRGRGTGLDRPVHTTQQAPLDRHLTPSPPRLCWARRAPPGRACYGPGPRAPHLLLHVPAHEHAALPAPALQRAVEAAVRDGPAVHAAVQPDLRVQHPVGQQGRPVRHGGRLPHHHLLAREPERDQETSSGEIGSSLSFISTF